MPIENMEEEGLAKNPNLEYSQLKFLLGTEKSKNDSQLKNKLLDEIKTHGKQSSRFTNILIFSRM